MTEPCAKHDMIGCLYCNPRPGSPEEPDSRPFTARYDSRCPECDLPIAAHRDEFDETISSLSETSELAARRDAKRYRKAAGGLGGET